VATIDQSIATPPPQKQWRVLHRGIWDRLIVTMQTDDEVFERARLRRQLPPPAVRRQLREQAGISQAEIAAVVGVTRECVSNWESGNRTPRAKHLERYLTFLQRVVREAL
jgi:DNA-binding transcriptional regulator YiaG